MSIPTYQIRADYDAETIVVYQAYGLRIGEPALEAQRFVPPFLLSRMTWIKPSFLWMMERCGWGRKAKQEVTLGVRITRAGWEKALSHAVLTHPSGRVYASAKDWEEQKKGALVTIQWDPERSLRGSKLAYRSIQVGISRHLTKEYANEWVVSIEDMRPLANKLYKLRAEGHQDKAKRLLPRERPYPVSDDIARRLGMA